MKCQAKIKRWFLLVGPFLLMISIIAWAESLPLRLDAHLSKQWYLEGEPIVIVLSITNTEQTELTVAEPLAREGFVKNVITTFDGRDPNAPQLVWDILMPPPSYGVRLDPGESLEIEWAINETYPYGLKPGKYKLIPIYDTTKYSNIYPEIWHGRIYGPELVFEVKVPKGAEKEAYSLLTAGRDILLGYQNTHYGESRKMLLDLTSRYPQSVYAPYAYYLLGKTYFVKQADKTQHFGKATQEFQNFLKKFPKYPYYSDIVRVSNLPYSLLKIGRTDLAQEILKEAPNGYYKQRTLRQIEKKGGQ